MPAPDADLFLIDAIRDGDPTAWRQIIERYQGRLVAFARRRLAQSSEAEDLVQEAFLGLLRSLPNYDRERSLETYLFAILRNKIADFLDRQQKGQRQSLDQLELDDAPAAWVQRETPGHALDRQEGLAAQRGALVKCLRSWVDRCCDESRFQELMIVEMLVVLGLRNKEVAADLNLTETGVAGIKFRVLSQWTRLTQTENLHHDWSDGDLARESSLGQIWRDEGISCPKRSTLGRYLLDALDADWRGFVDFHVNTAACERCCANIDDLRAEDLADRDTIERLRERCFASSVGFLSRPGAS